MQEWEGFAVAKSSCNQRMAYFNILFNFKDFCSSVTVAEYEIEHKQINFLFAWSERIPFGV